MKQYNTNVSREEVAALLNTAEAAAEVYAAAKAILHTTD